MFDHSVTIFNELVAIEPKYLNRRILEHIRTKLIEIKVNKCTKDFGFIKAIDIMTVRPAEISMADGSTRFSITYTIHSLLPRIGKVYNSKSVVVINHDDICGAVITVDDSCEGHPFHIFLINCVYKDKKYQFENCDCVLPSFDDPSATQFVLYNIVVDTVAYFEKQFRVTGKHIHNYKNPQKDDKKSCVKTDK